MHGARFTKWCTRAPLSPKPSRTSGVTSSSGNGRSMSTSTGRRRRGRARARHPRCGRLSGRSPRRGEKDLDPRGLPIPSRRATSSTPWPDHWAFKNPKGVAYWEALTWTAGPVDSATVQSSSDGGQDLCPHVAMGGQTPGVALVGGRVTPLPGGPAGRYQGDPGARGRPTSGRPTLLPGHLAQPGAEHSGPRPPVSSRSGTRGPTDPPLALPGIWPLKKELTGTPSSHGPGSQRITSVSSSVAHSWRRSPWAW